MPLRLYSKVSTGSLNITGLTHYFQDIAVDGLYQEWEFKISEEEYARMKAPGCHEEWHPTDRGAKQGVTVPYCRIFVEGVGDGSPRGKRSYVYLARNKPAVRFHVITGR